MNEQEAFFKHVEDYIKSLPKQKDVATKLKEDKKRASNIQSATVVPTYGFNDFVSDYLSSQTPNNVVGSNGIKGTQDDKIIQEDLELVRFHDSGSDSSDDDEVNKLVEQTKRLSVDAIESAGMKLLAIKVLNKDGTKAKYVT